MILGGIRWRTGTDWHVYLNFFKYSETYRQFTDGRFEYGYGLLSFFVKSLSSSYSVFLAIFGIFSIGIKAFAFRQWRYNDHFLVSLLIFYGYYIGDICPIRQSLALSITIFSGQYIIERRIIPFLLCVYLATLIHASSFVFLIAYPIATVNLKTKTVFFILVISAVGGYVLTSLNSFEWLTKIPGLADDAQDKLEAYSTMASQGIDTTGGSKFVDTRTSFIVGIIRKVVVLVPLLIFRKRLSEKYEHFNILFNLIIFGAVFYFTLGTFIQVLKRGASYFDFFEVLALPLFIFICETKWQRVIVYCTIAGYSFAKLYMVISYYWDAYVPYYSIFDDVIRNY